MGDCPLAAFFLALLGAADSRASDQRSNPQPQPPQPAIDHDAAGRASCHTSLIATTPEIAPASRAHDSLSRTSCFFPARVSE